MWRARPETLPESGRYDDREFERRDCLARPITHVPGRSGWCAPGVTRSLRIRAGVPKIRLSALTYQFQYHEIRKYTFVIS